VPLIRLSAGRLTVQTNVDLHLLEKPGVRRGSRSFSFSWIAYPGIVKLESFLCLSLQRRQAIQELSSWKPSRVFSCRDASWPSPSMTISWRRGPSLESVVTRCAITCFRRRAQGEKGSHAIWGEVWTFYTPKTGFGQYARGLLCGCNVGHGFLAIGRDDGLGKKVGRSRFCLKSHGWSLW
jgi:hypothetical protein